MSKYLVCGKNENLLWQIVYTFGPIFIVVKGKILKNNMPSGRTARYLLIKETEKNMRGMCEQRMEKEVANFFLSAQNVAKAVFTLK